MKKGYLLSILSSENSLMTSTECSSRRHQGKSVGKSFSEVKLVTDILLSSFMQKPTEKPLFRIMLLISAIRLRHTHFTPVLGTPIRLRHTHFTPVLNNTCWHVDSLLNIFVVKTNTLIICYTIHGPSGTLFMVFLALNNDFLVIWVSW